MAEETTVEQPEARALLEAQWPQHKRRRWVLHNCYLGHGQMLAKALRQVIKDNVEQLKTVYICVECGSSLVHYIPRSLAIQHILDEECLPPPLTATA